LLKRKTLGTELNVIVEGMVNSFLSLPEQVVSIVVPILSLSSYIV